MKKLLGLLGTITIAGSGMLGIVGNAPTTRIEENNLETLKRIKRETINANRKIKFNGFYDNYKGDVGLDTDNKKIIFFGNNEQFHSWLQERDSKRNYNKIVIKNKNFALIKEIVINVGDSMQGIISKYNLENGIDYQDGYIIEISSYEPWRTKYYENNNWKYITKDGSLDRTINNLQQTFIIKNNNFIKVNNLYDVIVNTQLGFLNNNNDQTIINAVKAQNNLEKLTYTIRKKQIIQLNFELIMIMIII